MSSVQRCARCRSAIDPEGVDAFCPACLLEGALPDSTGSIHTLASPPPAATHPHPKPESSFTPRSFGDYVLLDEIASGGMGIVHRAHQISLNRIVALKTIRSGIQATAEDRLRFRVEAEAAAKLQHPNIVTVHEVGIFENTPYLSMERVEGGNLSEQIQSRPLLPRESAQIASEIAQAIAFAHQRGVLHRDLKPSNILMDLSGRPRVTDFGLAKILNSDSSSTQTGTLLGSPSYMAPEQARGEDADITTDVHAMGAILYEMLTGQPPYRGATAIDTLRMVQDQEPMAPRQINPQIPRDLETICLKCLHKVRSQRYSSAQALAEDIQRFLHHEPVLARAHAPIERLARWCQRHPGYAAAVASCLILGIVIVLISTSFLVRLQQETRTTADAKAKAEQQLWSASISQARAERLSGLPGSRDRSLAALTNAIRIQSSPILYQEGAASLALNDLGDIAFFRKNPIQPYAFNRSFSEHVVGDQRGQLHFFQGTQNVSSRILLGHTSAVARLITAPGPQGQSDRLGIVYLDGTVQLRSWDPTHSNSNLFQELSPPLPFAEIKSQALALSDSGTKAALFTPSNGVLILTETDSPGSWSRQTIPIHTLQCSAAFSPRGDVIAITTAQGVELWSLTPTHPQLTRKLEINPAATAIAWHPNGSRLVTGHRNGEIFMWDLETSQRRALLGHSGYISTLAFSARGNWLLSHGWDGTSRFWNGNTTQFLLSMVDGLAVAMNDTETQVAFHRETGGFGIRSVTTSSSLITLPDRLPEASSLTFHPSQPWLASESKNLILIWDVQRSKRVAEIPIREPRGTLFHPDGQHLYCFSGDKLFRWKCHFTAQADSLQLSKPEMVTQEKDTQFTQARWSLNGRAIVASGSQYSAALGIENPSQRLYFGDYSAGSWLTVSPDSDWAAVSLFNGPGITLWRKGIGLVALLRTNLNAQLDFSPDGKWLAACTERSYHLWHTSNWSVQHEQEHTTGGVIPGAVRFSPNSRRLALTQDRRSIRIIDPATGVTLSTLTAPHPGLIKIIEFSPDGHWLAFYEEDSNIRLWDLTDLQIQLRSLGLRDPIPFL